MKKILAILATFILGYISLMLVIMIPKFAKESDSFNDYFALLVMTLLALLGIYLIRLIWRKMRQKSWLCAL